MTPQVAVHIDPRAIAPRHQSSGGAVPLENGFIGRTFETLLRLLGRAAVAVPPSTWLLIDLSALLLAVITAYVVFPPYVVFEPPHIALWQASAVFAFAVLITGLIFGLYERETLTGRSKILIRTVLTAIGASVFAYAIIYVVMYATVSRRATTTTMTVFLIQATAARMLAWWAIRRVHRGLIIVGSKTLFDSFRQSRRDGFLQEYQLVGYAAAEKEFDESPSDSNYLGRILDLLPDMGKKQITDIVVGARAALDPRVMDWLIPSLRQGCRVTDEAVFYEKATGQILVDEITPRWFLFADLKAHCDEHATLKRLVDLVTAAIGLIVSAPFWLLISLAIKLFDHGPVFYVQERVGQNGDVFKLYKFRTMRTNAENGRSVWCTPNDPRITRVGSLIRRMRLDELPQLVNVLMGQMSIVGPRPERPDIVDELCRTIPFYAERHLVKPGITGWAQISFRYGSSIEDSKRKLQFDLFYLKHMCFELDIIILLRTVGVFFRGGI